MIFRIYYPETFQGNLRKKNYFEGWYFKHVSKDLNHVYAIIPGISLTEKTRHVFIQVINGITGESSYVTYQPEEFIWDKKRLYLKAGNSEFTDEYIDLDIDTPGLRLTGKLAYSKVVNYPKSLFSPGIMGWYSFVPFMECKHGIVSVNHEITGDITVNNEMIDFSGGKGYIEKDWGESFPEAWIWIQANNFNDWNSSFSFSVAKIPWRGKFFIGFIAFLYYNKKFILFSTYNNSFIKEISHSGDSIDLTLKNKNNELRISTRKSKFGELRAPVSGEMSRRIKESTDSEVTLNLYDSGNKVVYCDSSLRAGVEVIDKIFEYLKN